MCLVGIAWHAHRRYPLILAGNRDEFHARAAAPADWWPDAPDVYGGRDLVAGGSWLGVTRSGRIAVVTNHPGRPPGLAQARSRGRLVRDYLLSQTPPDSFLDAAQAAEAQYAGFCLIAGDATRLEGLISPAGARPPRWHFAAGVMAISNAPLEAPWPKAGYLEAQLEDLLEKPDISARDLFAPLARREPVGDAEPDAGARLLIRRTPFVLGEHYGTRASTVVLLDDSGGWQFAERRFDAAGGLTGESYATNDPASR